MIFFLLICSSLAVFPSLWQKRAGLTCSVRATHPYQPVKYIWPAAHFQQPQYLPENIQADRQQRKHLVCFFLVGIYMIYSDKGRRHSFFKAIGSVLLMHEFGVNYTIQPTCKFFPANILRQIYFLEKITFHIHRIFANCSFNISIIFIYSSIRDAWI